jgi:hypothetical protein
MVARRGNFIGTDLTYRHPGPRQACAAGLDESASIQDCVFQLSCVHSFNLSLQMPKGNPHTDVFFPPVRKPWFLRSSARRCVRSFS